jgi:hypothetical protein
MIPPHHGPNFGTTSVMTTAVPLLEASLYKLGGCSVTSTRPLVNSMCSQLDGPNVATNQHSERPKLSSVADDTHTKPMAVTQRPTMLCKASSQGVPPSGGERMSATKPSQSPTAMIQFRPCKILAQPCEGLLPNTCRYQRPPRFQVMQTNAESCWKGINLSSNLPLP